MIEFSYTYSIRLLIRVSREASDLQTPLFEAKLKTVDLVYMSKL